MPNDLSLNFDFSSMEGSLQGLIQAAPPALGAALFVEAEDIMGESKENFVPVDFGTLRSSGHVQPPVVDGTVVEVAMGYGGAAAKYAAAVHENPRAGKTGGRAPVGKAIQVNSRGTYSPPRKYQHWAKVGGWKYLERPINDARTGFIDRVGGRFWENMAQRGIR